MSTMDSFYKVEAALEEPFEKDKREAEDVIEKEVMRVKRQKVEDEKSEEVVREKADKSDMDTSSVSEQPIKVCAMDGHVVSVSRDESSELVAAATATAKSGHVAAPSPEDETNTVDDIAATKRGPALLIKEGLKAPANNLTGSNEDSGSSSEDESNVDGNIAAADVVHTISITNQSGLSTQKKEKSESDNRTGSHVGAAMAEKTLEAPTKMGPPMTSAAPDEQTTGPKTLYVGNLSFSVEQEDVEDFFNAAGEIVGIRFGMNPDESFRGFGFVQFSSAEAARKALHELNGKELLRRPVKLDLVRERGSHTPYSCKDTQSFQMGERAQGKQLFVRGFKKFDGEDEIRSSLKEHFGSCGEITGVSIPKDQDGAIKGIAFIDFMDSAARNQALALNGSKFGGSTLSVEVARPKHNSHESGGSGSGRGWRSGDRDFDGRSGGWDCSLSMEEARPRYDSRDVGGSGYGWRSGDRDFDWRRGGWDRTMSMEVSRPRYGSRDSGGSGGSRDWRSGGWDFGGSSGWDCNMSVEEAKHRHNRPESRGWSSGCDFVGGSEGAGYGGKSGGWNFNLSVEGAGPRHYSRDSGSSWRGWRSGSRDFGIDGRGFGGRSGWQGFGGGSGGRSGWGMGYGSGGRGFGGRSDGRGFGGRSGGQVFGGRSGGGRGWVGSGGSW